jgi:Na+/phosphate symporter
MDLGSILFPIFTLFGGLAFFLYGMNAMSDSLEKLAGGKFLDPSLTATPEGNMFSNP